MLDDRAPEHFLRLARMGFRGVQQRRDNVLRQRGRHPEPVVHELVGDGHGFAELLCGGVGDADVVAEGLGHFLRAVGADEDGHDHHNLRRLALGFLEVAADEVVEGLVRSAKFDVRFDHHGVPALHERVHELVDVDRLAGFVAFLECVAFEHAGDGHFLAEFESVDKVHGVQPFGVVADFEFVRGHVENFAGLDEIRFGILFDLLGGEDGAGFLFAGGVADHGGCVADDEDGFVAEVLELAHFSQYDGVAEVEVGSGRVHAEFDAELAVTILRRVVEALFELVRRVDVIGAVEEELHLLVDGEHGVLLETLERRYCRGGVGEGSRGQRAPLATVTHCGF